ncbi:MAG: hypothetical protein HUJ71_06670 [Pseudobutyrivibrio sp.]|nr:hypothetical protein [Pseudobutyrivibrio sp.]
MEKKEYGFQNMNGMSENEDKTCGLNDMNCLGEDEKKNYDLNNMNAATKKDDKSCSITDMNCEG